LLVPLLYTVIAFDAARTRIAIRITVTKYYIAINVFFIKNSVLIVKLSEAWREPLSLTLQ
jgi:hypothetical protein